MSLYLASSINCITNCVVSVWWQSKWHVSKDGQGCESPLGIVHNWHHSLLSILFNYSSIFLLLKTFFWVFYKPINLSFREDQLYLAEEIRFVGLATTCLATSLPSNNSSSTWLLSNFRVTVAPLFCTRQSADRKFPRSFLFEGCVCFA